MTEREWLAMQGLAIPGARGRFSKEAQKALAKAYADGVDIASMTYEAPSKPVATTVARRRAPLTSKLPRRSETVLWAVDKGKYSNTLIALQTCGGCGERIAYCSHNVPLLPSYLGGGEGMLVKPVSV